MTTLSKDEVVRLAREAGYRADAKMHDHDYDLFLNFYTLCRAPLVAEVERLNADMKQMGTDLSAIQEIHNQQKAKLYAELADWKARALKAEQAGEPVAWRVHPFDYGIGSEGVYALTIRQEQVMVWRNKGWDVQSLYTQPQPAAQEQTSAVPVVEQLVEALCELVQSDGLPRTLEQLDASVNKAFAAITAGQQYLKENGK